MTASFYCCGFPLALDEGGESVELEHDDPALL